ncbi:H/ACA ribonucleoprotein complex subunit 2-like protein [Periplaneta americana]|uniref:H/ACA ribonucleoprotein complex subunit 2-like protein n=1 Tax=Periplaneta americana TaxID=6978 RepID=UPI0037E99C0D
MNKSKKDKKERRSKENDHEDDERMEKDAEVPGSSSVIIDDQTVGVSPIAQPMASAKLTKKIRKLIKACVSLEDKSYFRNGLKDVQSGLKKNERGLVIFAGDVTPVEIMCHLPAVCEEMNIPYIYVLSRQTLGSAMGVKRGSLMVFLKKHEKYADLYDEVVEAINSIVLPWE